MEVVVGNGKVRLEQTDFLAAGGQGSVYVKAGTAFKIYTDPAKMIPLAKISELSALSDPKIIKPEQIIYNNKKRPIGYTMKALDKTEALCRVFTKAFRQRNNIENDQIVNLVQQFQQTVKHIHSKGILVVDLNELNFLLDEKFKNIYCIDVDSYRTVSFPATALMESIRDRHMKPGQFDEGTDWFAWAIVTFQMFIGIHPYKGRHATLCDLDARMKSNVSVLNADVSVPKVCYPFDVIPQAYRDWYRAVFENGKRCPPPKDIAAAINLASAVAPHISGRVFVFDEIESVNESIVGVWNFGGRRIMLTPKHILYKGARINRDSVPVRVVASKKEFHPIAASISNGQLSLTSLDSNVVLHRVSAEDFTVCDGRLVVRNGSLVTELTMMEIGHNKFMPMASVVANVLPRATKTFDGCMVQMLLDACYVSIFPEKGGHHQIRIKEAEPYKRIIDAKYMNHVLMFIVESKGEYKRLIVRFDDNFRQYDVREQDDVLPTLNFVVLDNGLAAHIEKDERLVLFRNRRGDGKATVVEDASIETDMMLYRDGTKAIVARGSKLYRLSMK
ncbi:MAG: serine/threonine protein kinase [Candidatus Competibacteraceae bacterium]|nr:serine/threonine protein kinase [Candidatus Competibacteraceae bacterium]